MGLSSLDYETYETRGIVEDTRPPQSEYLHPKGNTLFYLSLGSGSFLICSRTISLLDLFSCSAIASNLSLSSHESLTSRRASSCNGFGTLVVPSGIYSHLPLRYGCLNFSTIRCLRYVNPWRKPPSLRQGNLLEANQ